MTVAPTFSEEVQEVSQEDFERAVSEALARIGLTIDALREQARTNAFVSEEARSAWFVVGPLVDAA